MRLLSRLFVPDPAEAYKRRIDAAWRNYERWRDAQTCIGCGEPLVTILGGVLLVYAQILPVFTRRALPALAERMSAIESEDELREFRGKLHLARYVLNTLKRYSLFRSVADEVVSELEEHIDSIDFVLGNRSRLDAAMSNLDKCA